MNESSLKTGWFWAKAR